jgi:hypothetical protein
MYDAAKHDLVWRESSEEDPKPHGQARETSKEFGQSRCQAHEELSAADEKVREVYVGWISREREKQGFTAGFLNLYSQRGRPRHSHPEAGDRGVCGIAITVFGI